VRVITRSKGKSSSVKTASESGRGGDKNTQCAASPWHFNAWNITTLVVDDLAVEDLATGVLGFGLHDFALQQQHFGAVDFGALGWRVNRCSAFAATTTKAGGVTPFFLAHASFSC